MTEAGAFFFLGGGGGSGSGSGSGVHRRVGVQV